jgi:hypothetical protein
MRAFRILRRSLIALFAGLCVLLCLTLAAGQVGQYILRGRAERLLAEVQALELRKTPWSEAQRRFQHWGSRVKLGDNCNEHECSLEITLAEPVFRYASRGTIFVFLDDYLRWRLKLSYDRGPFVRMEHALFHTYLHLGGRPAKVDASVGMRDGVVWSEGFSVTVYTFAHGVPDVWEGEYALTASVNSRSRLGSYGSVDPQTTLHQNYEIGRPGGCEVCVAGWVNFTPYTGPDEVRRLMQVDLSCLTRIHPCRTQSDIMPNAWAQYLAERQLVERMWGHVTCSAQLIEILGRDTANIVSGEIASYTENGDGDRRRGRASVKLLAKLKGGGNWKDGDIHEVGIFRRVDQPIIKTGSRLIFLFDDRGWADTMPYDAAGSCSPLSLSEANLNVVLKGISQDYGAESTPPDRQWIW